MPHKLFFSIAIILETKSDYQECIPPHETAFGRNRDCPGFSFVPDASENP